MNGPRTLAIVLILAGTLGLGYGKFSYNKDTETARIGSIELSVNEKKTVNVPVWAGVIAIAAGAVLLLAGKKA